MQIIPYLLNSFFLSFRVPAQIRSQQLRKATLTRLRRLPCAPQVCRVVVRELGDPRQSTQSLSSFVTVAAYALGPALGFDLEASEAQAASADQGCVEREGSARGLPQASPEGSPPGSARAPEATAVEAAGAARREAALLEAVLPYIGYPSTFVRTVALLLAHGLIPRALATRRHAAAPGHGQGDVIGSSTGGEGGGGGDEVYLRRLYRYLDGNSDMVKLRRKNARYLSRLGPLLRCTVGELLEHGDEFCEVGGIASIIKENQTCFHSHSHSHLQHT